MDDFWNTSIISVTAGMLMPFAGDVQTGAVRAYKMRGKDEFRKHLEVGFGDKILKTGFTIKKFFELF